MIQSAVDHSISKILDFEEKVTYVVPKFQREYIWGKDQWRELFDDIDEEEEGHYLGSILCVDRGTDALGVRPLEIIDGQQRLATISLIYAAIYDIYLQMQKDEALETEIKKEIEKESYVLGLRLVLKGKEKHPRVQLSLENKNLHDYMSILDDLGLCSGSIKLPLFRIRRIFRAYQYFRNRFSSYDYPKLKEILRKVNAAHVVKIEVNSESDAYALFESLNNRGIPLTPFDIIKTMILSELGKNEDAIGDASSEWLKLVENLDKHEVQERFLRQYYNAYKYDNNVRVKINTRDVNKATKSNLIKIYEVLKKRDAGFILQELVTKSKTYRLFDKPEDDGIEEERRCGLIDLLHIGAAPAYTFLLYLFTEYEKNTKLIADSVNFMVKYFLRRHLTDRPETRDLDDIFINLITKCREKGSSLDSAFVIQHLTNPERFSSIENLKEKLMGKIYEDNSDAARFVLCKLEEQHKTKEKSKDLWARDKSGRLVWSIEHIFPEGENIPKHWVDMIANGDAEKARVLQSEWVHKLGNLTITAYNPNLYNRPFLDKRDMKDRKTGEYTGYKNGLHLNGELASKNKWTIEDIEKRTAKLTEDALKLSRLDSEKVG